MNEKMLELMEQRRDLLASVGAQREQVAIIGSNLRGALSLADRGARAVHFLRCHPSVIAGVVAALFLIRRRSLPAVAWAGWRVWKIYRNFISLPGKLP